MPIVTPSQWAEFTANHPETHILQHSKWGELKAHFGWKPVCFINRTSGAQVLIRELPFGIKMAYIPMGPIGEDWSSVLGEIDSYCIQNRILFLKIEPDEPKSSFEVIIKSPGIIPSPHTIQPRRTIVLDISGEPQSLLARMKQKTRYNIGLSRKKGITIAPWDDLASFHHMMTTTGERDTFGVHTSSYYQKAYELFHPDGFCELMAAFHDQEPLAAVMVFVAGKRAWYFYGASSNQKRDFMPTYLLQWEAMLWAKNRGATCYDLWGVPDFNEEYLEEHFMEHKEGLWGVYRFKRGFGGDLIRSAGTFDRVYNRMGYLLYGLYLRLFKHSVAS
ncbi:MAG: peptidoglycan bridge formation glycyltransferase FemA/FemB family protein [Anaerolineaceae bacterium]|nr:peptidoglycan bridge formation glycyltransferase FemA/FemB family protein [Anaerolineaceae bacterium]